MEEKIDIKKVDSIKECLICNNLFEDLIKFESKLDEQINGMFKVEEFYERTLNKEDSVIFVAKDDKKIVGYVMAYIKKENKAVNNNIVEVMHIYIDEKYRKKNIGKSLMLKIEDWAKTKLKSFDIELQCVSNNINALKFYESLGYKNIRVRMRKNF